MDFKNYEDKGRRKFEGNCRLPHEFTADIFAPWDVSTTGKAHTFNIEIKDRDISFDKYREQGFWLEKRKYDALMEAYGETGSKPIYLCFFRGGIGIFWDLSELGAVEWCHKDATSTTANGSYGKKRVPKEVTFLTERQGKKFRYDG